MDNEKRKELYQKIMDDEIEVESGDEWFEVSRGWFSKSGYFTHGGKKYSCSIHPEWGIDEDSIEEEN